MNWVEMVTSVAEFLCTYLVHSTLILLPVWWLVVKYRWPADPGIRCQILKISFLAPLGTTLAMTVGGVPHFGLQIPLVSREFQEIAEAGHGPVNLFPANFNGYASSPGLASSTIRAEDFASSNGSGWVTFAGERESMGRRQVKHLAKAGAEFTGRSVFLTAIIVLWATIVAVGLLRLGLQWTKLRRILRNAIEIVDPRLLEEKECLRTQFGIRRSIALLSSSQAQVPMAAGIICPFILLPKHPSAADESKAMLAHELAHVACQDASWNLIFQVACRFFFFQPFAWLTSNAIRQEMEFKADSMAVNILGEQTSLIRCLYSTGLQLSGKRTAHAQAFVLASGMALFHSTLGQRIEAILETEPGARRPSSLTRVTLFPVVFFCVLSVALLAPRAVSVAVPSTPLLMPNGNPTMTRTIASLLVFAGLSMPATADEPTAPSPQNQSVSLNSAADKLPEGIHRFNGMLVGRVAAKDVEQGSFTVLVDAVPRVWENSQAENPRSILGKTIEVSGVFGKFQDVLVVTRIGDTVEFECKHDGLGLVFPGELLHKVTAYDPADYPVLPDGFRGFRGMVIAKVVRKSDNMSELIVEVEEVTETFEGNRAEQPKSIIGKQAILAGFWNRKDALHKMRVGDRIHCGMNHTQVLSNHLVVIESVRKLDDKAEQR